MQPVKSTVIRVGLTVAALLLLFLGYLLTGFGLHFSGTTAGFVLAIFGIEALVASILLARKGDLPWVSQLVIILGVLVLLFVGLGCVVLAISWQEGWFHLSVLALITVNAILLLWLLRRREV